MVGNFSPHEAFAIGGTNSVRGYEEGAVGSGRSYVVGSSEISFPVVSDRSSFFFFFPRTWYWFTLMPCCTIACACPPNVNFLGVCLDDDVLVSLFCSWDQWKELFLPTMELILDLELLCLVGLW